MWTEMPRYPLQQLLSSKLEWKILSKNENHFLQESPSLPPSLPDILPPPSSPPPDLNQRTEQSKAEALSPAGPGQYFNWTKLGVLPVMWHVDLRLRCRYPRYQCQYLHPAEHKHFNSSELSPLTSMTIYHFSVAPQYFLSGCCLYIILYSKSEMFQFIIRLFIVSPLILEF